MAALGDNQDKLSYCIRGEESEKKFLDSVAPKYGINSIIVHPDKAKDKYSVDFQSTTNGMDIDLKHQETPFFKAMKFGGIPASHAVTLNHKDYIRYMYKYPFYTKGMIVFFWVEWPEQEKFGIKVQEVSGVWWTNIHDIDFMIRSGFLKCHNYGERKGDVGTNAKCSWVLDLRELTNIPRIG